MPKKKTRYTLRSDGRIQLAVNVDGKYKYLYGKTDAEIEQKLIDLKATIALGKLFGDVLDEWQEWHDKTISIGTASAYLAPTKDARERFGATPINQITAKDIKAVLSEMARKDYSIKTIKKYYTIYLSTFDYAVENGYADVNVAASVTMPKFAKPAKKREAATTTEEQTIKTHVGKWLLPYFLLMTGLRKGEALAIQFKDIDREKKLIHVSKSVAFKYNVPYIKEPKTEAGYRSVPLLDDLAAVLPDGPPDDFLFSGPKPMTMMVFQRSWARFQRETGIQCTAHQLRHSYATMLYEAGIDLKQAQDLLGHADSKMTEDVYTHIRDSKRKAAADTLNEFLRPK